MKPDTKRSDMPTTGSPATGFPTSACFEALDVVVRREIADCARLDSVERLSGGASMETYRLRCRRASNTDAVFDICLRRAPDGEDREDERATGIEAEAMCMSVARSVGVPEPAVLYVLAATDGIGAGFLMEWLDGVTLGARIVRAPELAKVRSGLAFRCGQEMARIHGIDLHSSGLNGVLRRVDPTDYLAETWERYQEMPTPQPMIDFAGRWLATQLEGSEPAEPTLVHNDFRNGNVMIDPEAGLIAVLDWETAHIGDPMRDLGWICTNSWRFGQRHLPVGGFGLYEDLFTGYEDISGIAPDPERVRYWEVFGSFWWAVGCLSMADRYRRGSDATVERPGIGRRSSECQLDCVNLIIAGEVEFLPAVAELGLLTAGNDGRPRTAGEAAEAGGDMPRIDELLESVRDFLTGEVRGSTQGRTSFLALVAANSVDIALRERLIGPELRRYELERLTALVGDELNAAGSRQHELNAAGSRQHELNAAGSRQHELNAAGSRQHDELSARLDTTSDAAVADRVTALRWKLVAALRDGTMPLDEPGLAEYLRTSVAHQVAIDQPRYSAFRHIAGL